MHLMVTMPAGVRLELVTDAPTIELDVLLTRLELNGHPPKPAAFDLVVDGTVVASQESTAGNRILYDAFTQHVDFAFGEPTTIRFTDVATSAPASVEIWLPHDSVVEFRTLHVLRGRGSDGTRYDPAAMDSLRQLDQSLSGGLATHRDVAGHRGSTRRRRPAQPRVRRAMHARPDRRPDDPRGSRGSDQHQVRHQHHQRRHDARAHVRSRAARLPRHRPRRAPRSPDRARDAHLLPERGGPPGPVRPRAR